MKSQPNSHMTRRDALRAVGIGSLSTCLFTGRMRGANDRIGIGFIGAGGRAGDKDGLMSNFLKHADAQCVAVCDCFADRREQRAKQIEEAYAAKSGAGSYHGVARIADFRELLQRKDVDAVVIATPDHWHVPALAAAVRAGKDVYVEKPLSPSLEWNYRAREIVNRSGRIFEYGTQQRGALHVRAGCELVRSGAIGELKALEVKSPSGKPGGKLEPKPVPPGFDYEMWQGPAPERPYCDDRCLVPGPWHIYDYSIGFLGGWGAHPLDVLDWGLPHPVVPVEYEGTGVIPAEGLYNTVMDWKVRCTYANGLVMDFSAAEEDATKFIGSEGWIQIRRRSIESEPASLTAGQPVSRFEQFGRNHTRNFLDSIRGQSTPESPIDAAIRTDLVSHLSNIAVRTGRKIRWDPVKEAIIDDSQATKMMNRPLRSPWTI